MTKFLIGLVFVLLGAYVYGLNRSMPTTYAAPIYPFSPGMLFVGFSI